MGDCNRCREMVLMECTQDSEGKPSFKLSKPLFVAYKDVGMKDMAEKVLGHIIWLLEEVQKPLQSEVKRVRLMGNLAGKQVSVRS